MTIRSLHTAATGMNAQLQLVDVIANNLANVNTPGFRRDRMHFADLFYEKVALAGAPAHNGGVTPLGLQVGNGVRTVATEKEFSPGGLENTGQDYHLAIEGDANMFFRIKLPGDRMGYTRAGSFVRDEEGKIVTANGYELDPGITVPAEAKEVEVTSTGRIAYRDGQNRELQDLGQITLSRFVNPAGLQDEGDNVFLATAASGEPQEVLPGQQGNGAIRQHSLEQSNVSAISELIKLIQAQRSYEINSNVIKTSDQALQVINNLKA